MSIGWHDVVGTIGVLILLATYLALQLNRLNSSALSYSVWNGIGAALILVSLTQAFNLSAFLIESSWLLISLVGAVSAIRGRRGDPTEPMP